MKQLPFPAKSITCGNFLEGEDYMVWKLTFVTYFYHFGLEPCVLLYEKCFVIVYLVIIVITSINLYKHKICISWYYENYFEHKQTHVYNVAYDVFNGFAYIAMVKRTMLTIAYINLILYCIKVYN